MDEAPAELLIVRKTYDLVIWTCKHLARFPRSYRCTLGDRMEHRLYRILENLLQAKYQRSERSGLLRQTNMELEMLRFQFRMARDLDCLTLDSFGHAAREVNEIGKMVGGWLRGTAPASTT
jgi:hypothetical protein